MKNEGTRWSFEKFSNRKFLLGWAVSKGMTVNGSQWETCPACRDVGFGSIKHVEVAPISFWHVFNLYCSSCLVFFSFSFFLFSFLCHILFIYLFLDSIYILFFFGKLFIFYTLVSTVFKFEVYTYISFNSFIYSRFSLLQKLIY